MQNNFLRRSAAAKYLREKYGFGTERSLAKLATVGGGPKFQKMGRLVFYSADALDEWVASRMSGPIGSTSEYANSKDVAA